MQFKADIMNKEYAPNTNDYRTVSWWKGDIDALAGITDYVLEGSIYCKANPVMGELIHFPGLTVRLVYYNPYTEVWGASYVSGNTSEPDEESGEAPVGRTQKALDVIQQNGGVDGSHHKQWVLDQVARILTETPEAYQVWCRSYSYDDKGEYYGEWDEGIAP